MRDLTYFNNISAKKPINYFAQNIKHRNIHISGKSLFDQ